jgi:hypothetical protein
MIRYKVEINQKNKYKCESENVCSGRFNIFTQYMIFAIGPNSHV